MAQLELPLPEVTVEDFSRAWKRFELVATAKEWNSEKRAKVLPTLLRGKLVDIYIDLDEATKEDLAEVKKALMKKAGLIKDPLVAGKEFMVRSQVQGETVEHFAEELSRLFSQAYPTEAPASDMLLQRFLTGILPSIGRQLLLRGKPTTFKQAIKDASDIEYALNFEPSPEQLPESRKEINVVTQKQGPMELQKLQETLDRVSTRLEALELRLSKKEDNVPSRGDRRPRRQTRQNFRQTCWQCGEMGHFQRNCPLNYNGPARPVGSWPPQ